MLSITKVKGNEDQPIPLLLDSKGVIDAFCKQCWSVSELELTDLPKVAVAGSAG